MVSHNSLFLTPAIAGIIFIVVGLLMDKHPPKKINTFYGYKTPASMKSQERWDFAQKYAAREMTKTGVILAVISLVSLLIKVDEGLQIIFGTGVVLLMVIITIARTERAIKNKFEKKSQ